MSLWFPLSEILSSVFSKQTAKPELTGPEAITLPAGETDVLRHADFLLKARDYVWNHPVPEDRKGDPNQYSHAGDPVIGSNPSRPALTNCCYEHFGTHRVSIGVPRFIKVAPILSEGFNPRTLWNGLQNVLDRYDIAATGPHADTKFNSYLPLNHYYIEAYIEPEKFEAANQAVRYYTTSTTADPVEFIDGLDKIMIAFGFPPKNENRAELISQR